jgi:hypothetical protein
LEERAKNDPFKPQFDKPSENLFRAAGALELSHPPPTEAELLFHHRSDPSRDTIVYAV